MGVVDTDEWLFTRVTNGNVEDITIEKVDVLLVSGAVAVIPDELIGNVMEAIKDSIVNEIDELSSVVLYAVMLLWFGAIEIATDEDCNVDDTGVVKFDKVIAGSVNVTAWTIIA